MYRNEAQGKPRQPMPVSHNLLRFPTACRVLGNSRLVQRDYCVLGQQAPAVIARGEAKGHTSPMEEGAGHWKRRACHCARSIVCTVMRSNALKRTSSPTGTDEPPLWPQVHYSQPSLI